MAVIEPTKEFVVCACLEAINIYHKAGQFGQPVLASVATVFYIHTVSRFHMQQPHQRLLNKIVVALYPPVGMSPIVSG